MTAPTPVAPARKVNPYVGPQSFRYGQALYGRARETADLLDLLIAERIVLLYSPSGAGKTSLIEAALRPSLEAERFEVLPLVRVTRELGPGAAGLRPRNRYVMSTLLSLESGLPLQQQRSLAELDAMTIGEYLGQWPDLDGRPGNEVIFFDQFEEILADPVDQDAKGAFFAELGEALRDRHLWTLFAMREDFLAGLDPYLRLVPTRLQNRYRLDALTVDAALQAMTRPAHEAGVDFTESAATSLIDDLRRVRVQRPSGVSEELGRYVEPVQLQVVCHRVWERLEADARQITDSHIAALGDVDSGLADYYTDTVAAVATATGVPERVLRDWFEQELITPQGFRAQVISGPEGSDHALRRLTESHLLRAEDRRGAIWYELVHDRLIDPIRSDNARWREEHLTAFERQVMLWEAEGRPDGLLVAVPGMPRTEQHLVDRDKLLSPYEQDFLRAYERAWEERAREVRSARRTRRLLVLTALTLVVALVAAALAVVYLRRAEDKALEAERNSIVGQGYRNIGRNVELALLLGIEAVGLADGRVGDGERALLWDALAQAPTLQVLGERGRATDAAGFSPGGEYISTADVEEVQLWSRDGDLVASTPTEGWPSYVSASQDGQVLAWSDRDQDRVWVWDRASGRPPDVFDRRRSALSRPLDPRTPDLVWAATVSADGTSLLLEGTETVRITSLDGADLVPGLDYSSDGFGVISVSASEDFGRVAVLHGGGVDVWDTARGTRVTVGELEEPLLVGMSPDGATLVVLDGDELSAWSVDRSERLWTETWRGFAVGLDVAPGPGPIAVTEGSGSIDLFDAAGDYAGRRSVGAGEIAALEIDPRDPGRALVIDHVGPARLVDVAFADQGYTTGVATSETGLIATSTVQGDAVVWPPGLGTPSLLQGPAGEPLAYLAFSRDGSRLVTGDEAGVARVWDVAAEQELVSIEVGSPVLPVALSDSGLVATGSEDGVARVWDAETGELVCDFGQPDQSALVHRVAFDDANRLLVADGTGEATLVDPTACRALRRFGTSEEPDPLAESPRVAVSDPASSPWQGESAQLPPPDGGPEGGGLAPEGTELLDEGSGPADADAAIEPRGRWVATADLDGVIRLWSDDPGEDAFTLPGSGSGEPVWEIAFSPDGTRLAAAHGGDAVSVWDVQSRQQLPSIEMPAPIFRLAFDAEGRLVLPVIDGLRPMAVPLDDDELVEMARRRTTRELTEEECERWLPSRRCHSGGQ